MPCASCGSSAFCGCEALVATGRLVGGPPPPGAQLASRPLPGARSSQRPPVRRPSLPLPPVRPAAAAPPSVPLPRSGSPAPDACRCGAAPIGECSECLRPVCDQHSQLWRGWRVCDRDVADARIKAQLRLAEEERRTREALAAAAAERERQRHTLLELSPEEALEILYAQDRPTEQEIRSAVHVLLRLRLEEFTPVCLDVLRELCRPEKGHRRRVRRVRGWSFAGPHHDQRAWFLARSGHWYRSGSYGHSGARAGGGDTRRIRLDPTERRAIVHELAAQQEFNGLLRP